MTKHTQNFLILSTLILTLGTGCTQTQPVVTNTNSANVNVANTNTTNIVAVMNDATNTSTVDTSDWQTYTNEEYGFSFKYSADWTINGAGEKNINISITSFNDMPNIVEPTPSSQVSPITKADNELEKTALQKAGQSNFNGVIEIINGLSFIKYIGYIEGGALKTEYVTFKDNTKISIQYAEGDNADFVNALEATSRTELLTQYQNKKIQNSKLSERDNFFRQSISTFQFQ